MLAEPALSTTDKRRNDDAIAFFDVAYFRTGLDNFSHEFVPDHFSGPHSRNVTGDKVQSEPQVVDEVTLRITS